MSTILAIAEARDGALKSVSFQVVSEAKRQAAKGGHTVEALVIGAGVAGKAAELAAYGATKVHVAEVASYSTDAYARIAANVAKSIGAVAVFIPATAAGKDFAGQVAVALDTGLCADVVSIAHDGGKFSARRPVYAGKAVATVELATSPFVVTLRPNVFPAENATGSAEEVVVDVSGLTPRVSVKEFQKSALTRPDLAEASIIVSGGRGIKGKAEGSEDQVKQTVAENYKLIEALADKLGAAVGASRAVVDSGWRPHRDQVGQTGKTVSPNLYVACGISGAIQHLAGMSSSKVIVAINKDPEAPIFQVATYGIVGDLFEVVPEFAKEVEKVINS
ncbi:MAG: electron transfer flavoprotein subunit alpha/FixB family protein [Planctomycetes bacterium]|nr:electron transfer flavoprotein subunit alpha/FixB family protein [Planctomycetota bacterium]